VKCLNAILMSLCHSKTSAKGLDEIPSRPAHQ
jgi:hypothetical protein